VVAASFVVVLTACSPGSSEHGGDSSEVDRPAATDRSIALEPTRGETAVARMTLREKAGQVIVAAWSGTGSPAPMVRRLHLGGVVALEQNITSLSQIRGVNRSIARVVARRGYPAFIAVDQEGGVVRRVHLGVTPFPAFMSAGAADDTALTRRTSRVSAAEMRGLGFDVVLAPVADVSVGDRDAVVGSRAAGGRPGLVARHVVAAIHGIEGAGVLPVVKHFPGHGSLEVDSHRALPVQRRRMPELRATDLVPFAAAVRAQAPAVMTGHIAVRVLGAGVPASVSRPVTSGLLRREMGYGGLIVTDALDMEGVQQHARGGAAAVRALRAGADVVLMPPDPNEARDQVVRAVRSGRLPLSRLESAAARMIDTLHAVRGKATGTSPRPLGSGGGASLALSRAAVTSVAGPCRGRLIADRVRVVGPSEAVAMFDRLVSARGVTVVPDIHKRVRVGTRTVVVGHRRRWARNKVVDKQGDVSWERVRKRVPIRRNKPVRKWVMIPADAPTVSLVGYGEIPAGASDVVVALDRPGVLGGVQSRVELATYGTTPQAFEALIEVLLGDHGAPGHLPIDVPGAERRGCPGPH
jgi:beta-N-acetylhexosaminidase